MSQHTPEEQQANARLIAKAPELKALVERYRAIYWAEEEKVRAALNDDARALLKEIAG